MSALVALPVLAVMTSTAVQTATVTAEASKETPPADFADHWWFSFGGHASFFGDLIDRSTLQLRFGYGFHVGYRFGPWGVFGQIQQDIWTKTEAELTVERGVVNMAAGLGYRSFGGRVRSSVAMGISSLAQDQAFDEAGSLGVFFELRPVGLMFPVAKLWVVRLDPLFLAVEAPVIAERSLTEIQYRTAVTIEYDL